MLENRIGLSEKSEKSFERYLFRYHREKLDLVDKLINIFLKIFANICEESLKKSGMSEGTPNSIEEYFVSTDLLASEDSNLVCSEAAFNLLCLAKRQLLAARRLLFSGYLESMVALLRGSAESLYYLEICRQDFAQAKDWLRGKYIGGKNEPKGLLLHKVIYKYRRSKEWMLWGRLSGMGVHPKASCRVASLAGEFIGLFTEHDNTKLPVENARYIELFMEQMEAYLDDLFLNIIQFSYDLNLYLRDIYKEAFNNAKDAKEELNEVKGELISFCQNISNRHRQKTRQH